jgi:hypothetical protein
MIFQEAASDSGFFYALLDFLRFSGMMCFCFGVYVG